MSKRTDNCRLDSASCSCCSMLLSTSLRKAISSCLNGKAKRCPKLRIRCRISDAPTFLLAPSFSSIAVRASAQATMPAVAVSWYMDCSVLFTARSSCSRQSANRSTSCAILETLSFAPLAPSIYQAKPLETWRARDTNPTARSAMVASDNAVNEQHKLPAGVPSSHPCPGARLAPCWGLDAKRHCFTRMHWAAQRQSLHVFAFSRSVRSLEEGVVAL